MVRIFRHIKSNQKDLLTGIVSGLVLGIVLSTLGLGLRYAKASIPLTISYIASSVQMTQIPLRLESSVSDVVAVMLNSHNLWKTIDAKAITIWEPGKNAQTVTTSIQIHQISQARLDMLQVDSSNQLMADISWVSDGSYIYEQDNLLKKYTEQILPPFVNSMDNFGPSTLESGTSIIVRHPMAMIMPSPIADYIYPTGLIQRKGTVTLIGTEIVANRDTIIISWNGADENGFPTGKAKYWIDAQTGMILKAQVFGGESWDSISEETTFTEINIDKVISPDSFEFQSEQGYQAVSPLEFSKH